MRVPKMAGTSLFVLALLLVMQSASGEIVNRDSCQAGPIKYNSVQRNSMDQCCWYKQNTCCGQFMDSIVFPAVAKQLGALGKSIGTNNQCYLNLASIMCYQCSPQTLVFTRTVAESRFEIDFCLSYCQRAWDSCKPISWERFGYNASEPKTAEQFCDVVFEANAAQESNTYDISVSVVARENNCYAGPEYYYQVACTSCMSESRDYCEHNTSNALSTTVSYSASMAAAATTGHRPDGPDHRPVLTAIFLVVIGIALVASISGYVFYRYKLFVDPVFRQQQRGQESRVGGRSVQRGGENVPLVSNTV